MRRTHAPHPRRPLGSRHELPLTRRACSLWRRTCASIALLWWLSVSSVGGLLGCAADGPPFTRCAGGEECAAPADGCYELRITRSDGSEATGRQCTLRCAGDQDCPDASVCLVLEGDPTSTPLCLATCALPSDCFAGSRCTDVDGPLEVMSVCLP
jgi:hypothetical protein